MCLPAQYLNLTILWRTSDTLPSGGPPRCTGDSGAGRGRADLSGGVRETLRRPSAFPEGGGGVTATGRVGVLLASRGWAGQTPPPWHGGEPLPRPCHTRRLSLLSLHLHSLSSSTLPPFIYSFLHLSPLITSFNPLFFIATLYCHYSLLPH